MRPEAMMKKVNMKVIATEKIAKDTIEMRLEDDYITQHAKPGQFIYIALPNFTLRRPISIATIDKEKRELTILFKILGKGTRELSMVDSGLTLDCIGPNGNGFSIEPETTKKALLIGGGIGVPPLHNLGRSLKAEGIEVTSILGFQTESHVFYENEFNKFGETVIVTDDGSYGKKGFVTNFIPPQASFDTYYACGPTGMLQAVIQKLEDKRGFVSLEERMGCGIGACSACVVEASTTGYLKVCHDGPVFSREEIIL